MQQLVYICVGASLAFRRLYVGTFSVWFVPGGENNWSEGSVVLWAAVCGHKRPHDLVETQQEGRV